MRSGKNIVRTAWYSEYLFRFNDICILVSAFYAP